MRKDKLCFSVCVIFAMILILATICHSSFQYSNRIGISDQRRFFRNFIQQHKPFNSSLYSFSLINGLTKQRESRSGKCHSHEHCQEHRYCSCHGYCQSTYGESCTRGIRDTADEQVHYRLRRKCMTVREKKHHECEHSDQCECGRHCSCSGFCVHSCRH